MLWLAMSRASVRLPYSHVAMGKLVPVTRCSAVRTRSCAQVKLIFGPTGMIINAERSAERQIGEESRRGSRDVPRVAGLERGLIDDEDELAADARAFVAADGHPIGRRRARFARSGHVDELGGHDTPWLAAYRHHEIGWRQIPQRQALPIQDTDVNRDELDSGSKRRRLPLAVLLCREQQPSARDERGHGQHPAYLHDSPQCCTSVVGARLDARCGTCGR